MGLVYVSVRLFVLTLVFNALEAQVRLVDNGYEDLKIIIKDTVKEDPELIDRIKDVFTDASALMFKATKQRAYFRNITIVVPKKWAKKTSYDLVPAVNVFNEHVRVDRKNKAKGNKPYVRGNVECGRPGWFLHVTPKFLKKASPTKYGDHDKIIVHEWGHLRWGLFDEYASISAPNATKPNKKIHFYNEDGKWKPVACSADIEGQARTNCKKNKGKTCNVKKLQLPGKCTFCPNRKQKNIRSSLMGHQWISTMDSFCDVDSNSTLQEFRHNSRAPNLQNKMCNGRSSWEVMREHEDFSGSNNPTADAGTDTTPYFHVVQETGRVRVLVFDVSGSMKGQKIIKQKQAAYMAINTLIEKGSMLGIVHFNSKSKIEASLTEVKNSKVRKELRVKVPTVAGGGTDIYRGLYKAVKLLESAGVPTRGAEILLLTDGESEHPYLNILPKLKEKGVTVNTIAITNEADASMATLARDTAGRSFTYLETDTVSFADVLGEAVETGNTDHDKAEKVFSGTIEIADGTSGQLPFYLDGGLGNETIISAYLNISCNASLRIEGGNEMEQLDYQPGEILELELEELKPGKYTLEILTAETDVAVSATVTVTSRPVSEDVDVIRVTSYLSTDKLDFSQEGDELKLYANVEKGGNPVLNAKVTAVLAGEASFPPVELQLQDKGIFADAVADDGVYSAYLNRKFFNGNSRYNAKIRVSGEGGAFVYESEISGSSESAVIPGEESDEDLDFEPVTLENFYRQSLPGEITVVNYEQTTSSQDTTPPSRVSDLVVDNIRYHTGPTEQSILYTLSWTAVGEDMDVGRAKEYDLRMHEDIDILRESFESARVIPVKLPEPSDAGVKETVTVSLNQSHCNGTCYLGLKVKDASGLVSELSNIVNADVNFSYEPEGLTADDNGAGPAWRAVLGHVLLCVTLYFIVH